MADETKLTAATRLEKLLDNIAGGENDVTPATRLEKFLSYIADAMEGGGGSGGGGDFQIFKNPQYYVQDMLSAVRIYRYDSQNQSWEPAVSNYYELYVLPENFDSSKLTFIGDDTELGYNVHYMSEFTHVAVESTDNAAGSDPGIYIKENTTIYMYSNISGAEYAFLPAGITVEYVEGGIT